MVADRAGWRGRWVLATGTAAIAATVLDGWLLQRERGYFTGGFLSVDHISGPTEAVAFLAGSLLADVAVVGVFTTVALWILGSRRTPPAVTIGAAVLLGLVPILIADLVSYQIFSYLGDAFDFDLMFDLTGRSPMELLAVSSAHLVRLGWMIGAAAVAIAAVVWTVRRRPAFVAGGPARPSLIRALPLPLALLLVGGVGTALLRASSDVLDNGFRRKPSSRWLGRAVELLTDVDRDGYGALGRPEDPNLFDSRVRPYAIDVPGNGIDEDGVAGDLPASAAPYRELAGGSSIWRSTPDVILVVLESFRADAVGARYEGKPVTPVLDELARRGISASRAYSHNGYTVQSRRHIFAGSTADVRGDATLLDDFKAHGYEAAYFSAQDESFGGPRQAVGFDRADVSYDARREPELRFTTYSTAGSLAIPYTVLGDRIGAFLKNRAAGRPLFLYVNFQDTHFPYHHRQIQPLINDTVLPQSEITPDRAAAVRAMYLNTAANVDRAIGRVLTEARSSLARDPAVIVLSDHGESLFDEGFLGHGYTLNDAQTRIPLVVANLPITIEEPFGEADLRNAIDAGLAAEPEAAPVPVLRTTPSKEVFQYLGTFERPRQIALTGMNGRIIYDFRAAQVQTLDREWRRPEALEAPAKQEFVRLVQTWERMILARRAGAAEDN